MAASASNAIADDRTLVIERVFDAPPELVFAAWTDPEQAKQWMGPRDYPAFQSESDLRVGGKWRSGLRSPDGRAMWNGGVYREIVPPKRLVYTFAWDEDSGMHGPETLVTVDLAEIAGGKTRMTMRQAVFDTTSNRDGHRGGWNSMFDRLAEYLARAR